MSAITINIDERVYELIDERLRAHGLIDDDETEDGEGYGSAGYGGE